MVISLSLSRPFPVLDDLLAILRRECKVIRYCLIFSQMLLLLNSSISFIIISLERPPKQILNSAQVKARNKEKGTQEELLSLPSSSGHTAEGKQLEMKRISVPSGGN